MKKKINSSIQLLHELLPDYFGSKKAENEVQFQMRISAAGVQETDVRKDEDEGVIIVEGVNNIVIEESDRYCPWNRYSTYGFYRSVILPENILVKDVQVKTDEKGLLLYW
ncbi:MAG: Hsp20/alpha crystallin family protein [Crocinitomicaceae bacterium]